MKTPDKSNETIDTLKLKRKQKIKLISVVVLFLFVFFVFSLAWFTYFRSSELNKLSMTAVGRDAAGGSVNVYYYDTSGNWNSIYDENGKLPEILPGESKSFKLIMQNDSSERCEYQLEFESIKVKYHAIQPFDYSNRNNLWVNGSGNNSNYWYNASDSTTEFPYSKSIVMAGEYYDNSNMLLDYHNVTTEQFMSFLKPATNSIKYGMNNYSVVSGGNITDALNNYNLTDAEKSAAEDWVKENGSFICTTSNQDLSLLNTSEPISVIPSDINFNNVISSYMDDTTSFSPNNTITIEGNTVSLIYLTLYFDPNVYSTANIAYNNGELQEVTLKNSNPFMQQYIYLNIKLKDINSN